jgi:uncharacterized protein YcbK (DUF882 family)
MDRRRNESSAGGRVGRRVLLAGLGSIAFAGRVLAHPRRERFVHLACPETGESFSGRYWTEGGYLPNAMRSIDWLMRDFHCGAVAEIDPKLVDLLHDLRLHAGTRRPVSILSGYRTLETNDELRGEGMPAAVHSQHLIARAADVAIEGVSVPHLHALAVHLQRGGVGGYDHYIHVDTGPVRDWSYHHHPGHPPHHRHHKA